MKTHSSGFRRLFSAAIGTFILAAAASPGTLSVTALNWYPSPGIGTDGGYINFSGLDVKYGFSRDVAAPEYHSGGMGPPTYVLHTYATPTVMGIFRWTVRWTGAAGETPPSAPATGWLLYTATGDGASANAICYSTGLSCDGYCNLNDPQFPLFVSRFSNVANPWSLPTYDPPSGSPRSPVMVGCGTSTWSFVAGTTNTWESTVMASVNSGALMYADADDPWLTHGSAGLHYDITIHLSSLDGHIF